VFKQLARRGKHAVGGFDGFKLHLVVNDHGERLACRIMPGNIDERQPVPDLTQGFTGKLIADRGAWLAPDHQDPQKQAKQAHAVNGSAVIAQAGDHRKHQRSAQKHPAD
jgi:hypothetical protein